MVSLLYSIPLVFAQATTDVARITVEDPMLAAPPAAAQNVGGWQEALRILRDRSTELGIAHAAVARAEASSRIALAALLPQINGSVNATAIPYTSASSLDTTTLTLRKVAASISASGTLVQPLIAPRAIYGLGTAHANEETARLSEADTKRLITLNAANAMVSVVSAERVADLNRSGLRGALERLDVAQRRRAGGAATGLDVVRAQQDIEAARATLVQGDEALRRARESLGLALGIPGEVGIASSFDARSLEDGARMACQPAASIEERTDLMVAKQQIVVAHRTLTDAKLQFSPILNAQSNFSTSNTDVASAASTLWNIQAVLQIPIWDGGARYGNMRDANAQIAQAQQRLEATRRTAIVQVAQATRGVDVGQQALEVATRGRDLAADVDRLTRRGFAEGSGTSLELVIAASALRQAEINLALKEFELLRAKITAALTVANCDL